MEKQENLEAKVDRTNDVQIYQTVGIIGTGLWALRSLISRYYFQSKEIAQCFDRGMIAGIGFTIGGSWIKYITKNAK